MLEGVQGPNPYPVQHAPAPRTREFADPASPPGRVTPHLGLWVVLACAAVLVLCAGFAALVQRVAGFALRSTDASQQGLAIATRHPRLIAAIGAPIEPGWLVSGNVELANDRGHAEFAIPISGPRGSGTLDVVADKAAGSWTFSTLSVRVAGGGAQVDLLPTPSARPR